MTQPGVVYKFGEDKIGGTVHEAGTIFRIKYTNTNPTTDALVAFRLFYMY